MGIKGTLVTNSFLRTDKFAMHYEWLNKAAIDHNIELSLIDNGEYLCSYDTECINNISSMLADNSFVIYWDKDIRLGRQLTTICEKRHIPIYNSIEAIRICDDKSETYRKLWEWNNSHGIAQQIPLLPTIVAPMTYPNIGYTNMDFLEQVEDTLGLPVVVKECFGSFGMQVYLAHSIAELKELTNKLAGKPIIYQKFLQKSSGFDVRLQVVGEQVVASMYRYTTDGDFRANITHGGSMKPYKPSESECQLAINTVKALELDFAGVDLLFSNGKNSFADVVCEVNSNAHFKNIHTCTGVNVADKIIEYVESRL